MPPVAVYEVATFYTMYNLQADGPLQDHDLHQPAVRAAGRDEAAEHLKAKLGIGFDETTADGAFTLQGRRVHGRLRRRAGAARQQQADVQLDATATSSTRCSPSCAPRPAKASDRMNAPAEFLDYGPDAILMAGLTGTQLAARRLRRARRLRGAEEDPRREDPAGDGDRRGEEVGAARPRRRGLPDRPQVELHAAAVRRATSTSSAIPTKASPARSRTATSCATTRTR